MNRNDRRRGKKQIPFIPPKSTPQISQQTLVTTVHAQSNWTGINHTFGNVKGWEKVIADHERRKAIDQTQQLIKATSFHNWLTKMTINKARLSLKLDGCGFRFANPDYGPITIVGSVGNGGRFNIGSAQMTEHLADLRQFGCVYMASSAHCATEEAAKPIGCYKMYEVTAKQDLMLWDLKTVIDDLKYDGLMDTVRASYGDRMWCLQKVPVLSQIIGHRLKAEGGAGIKFESTKVPGHMNVALFFDTDDAAKAALDFK